MKIKNNTSLYIKILWIVAVLVSIKTIFTDFGADNAYSMVMSYRHITGDRMFLEMWEPHQTSIFLTDILMWVYGLIVPSFTGVAVYLQVCGTLFFAVIAVFLFKEIKALSGKIAAHFAAIFFLVFRAKQTVFPEFSNLQIGFSALMLLTLMGFLKDQSKKYKPVISSLFFCLAVLSYPSYALALVPVIVIICVYSNKKLSNSLIFAGTASATGLIYTLYFVLRIGPSRFMECVKGIVNSDSHANTTFVGGFDYYRGMVVALAWIAAAAVLALVISLVTRVLKKQADGVALFAGILCLTNVLMLVLQRKTGFDWTCCFYIIPVVLMALGFANIKNLTAEQKRFFISGVLVSAASCLAAGVLSDLGIITFVPFMALGGAVSFAAIKDVDGKSFAGVALILATVLFTRGFVVWGYANKGHVMSVDKLERYVKGGPTIGLLTDYMTSKEIEVNMAEFAAFVNAEDKLFVVGDEWLFDPAVYMATPVEIANYSVIDTPYYNEEVEHYFSVNPEKMPTIVAVKCWFGGLYFTDDTYIMQWVNRYYEPMGDGSYYRFYRLSGSAQ
ncbi:MAG: hypothetical protein J5626_01320 [Lachnospiraceae bacterium]|nr:hypothetical protein [Lachnospiraceae bacterium]